MYHFTNNLKLESRFGDDVLGQLNRKLLNILDGFLLLINQIVEGKKIDNEFERERLRIWKSDMKRKLILDEEWPENFEEEWE